MGQTMPQAPIWREMRRLVPTDVAQTYQSREDRVQRADDSPIPLLGRGHRCLSQMMHICNAIARGLSRSVAFVEALGCGTRRGRRCATGSDKAASRHQLPSAIFSHGHSDAGDALMESQVDHVLKRTTIACLVTRLSGGRETASRTLPRSRVKCRLCESSPQGGSKLGPFARPMIREIGDYEGRICRENLVVGCR